MQFHPHDYQRYCIEQVESQANVGLMIEMGLGKTVITLTALDDLISLGEVQKALVIAPLRVAQSGWSQEAKKWDHLHNLRVSRILGNQKSRETALKEDADIYVINRENVPWLVDKLWPNWPFDTVVIDELSSFKSSKAQRFKSLRMTLPKTHRVIGLTGTPSPNGLLDLWPQIYLLDRGKRLGRSFSAYRDCFFMPDKRSNNQIFSWKIREGAEREIYNRLQDLCISMKARDYISMPERLDVMHEIELSPEALRAYRSMEKQMLMKLMDGQQITALSAGAVVQKLLQIASGTVYNEQGVPFEVHDAKLNALEDLVESANGQPVLIYYGFRSDIERIRGRIEGVRMLEGEADVEAWNRGEVPVLLCHPDSAGHGLNLQAGGHILIWYTLPWSLEKYQQANARLHRQGQHDTVTIHHLIAKGTIDEDVLQALQRKTVTQDGLLQALKARIGLYEGNTANN